MKNELGIEIKCKNCFYKHACKNKGSNCKDVEHDGFFKPHRKALENKIIELLEILKKTK